MNFRIAIPSYKRSETIRKKTLHYLLDLCNVDASRIDVFVASEEEYKDYKYLEEEGIKVIIGVPTLRSQRNFITNWYNKNDFILNMDDDVELIYRKDGDGIKPFYNLDLIVKTGFNHCIKNKTKLFGICAVSNGFFMKENISTNLKYIVGCFWGQIIDKDISLLIELEDKEDFERTIKYYDKFRKVVRLDMFSPKTAYYKESGGMQETRTDERVDWSAHWLIQRYPQYCSLNETKKSKHTEIKLRHKINKD
jgi:hypothetical protein